MDRLERSAAFRTITPVAFGGTSRLTFKRLRSPTRLPTMQMSSTFSGYLARLNWLLGGR